MKERAYRKVNFKVIAVLNKWNWIKMHDILVNYFYIMNEPEFTKVKMDNLEKWKTL